MASRSKKTRPRAAGPKSRKRARPAKAPALVIEGVQQIWLAGMGAIARAQKEGPAAFQDAVAEGLKLLSRSRSAAQKMVQDAFDDAQVSVQSRLEGARDQAGETWDNLELLFQNKVQRALQQLGVPNADEIRLLTKRVAELNDNVLALSRGSAGAGRGKTAAKRKSAAGKATAKRPAKRSSGGSRSTRPRRRTG